MSNRGRGGSGPRPGFSMTLRPRKGRTAPTPAPTPTAQPKGGTSTPTLSPMPSPQPAAASKTLSPMPKTASGRTKAPGPDRSTRGRYLQAGARDDARRQGGHVGASAQKFELEARKVRLKRATQPSQSMQTPYGPVNISKFHTKDPGARITTRQQDYQGHSVGHKYSEMVDALVPTALTGTKRRAREQEVAGEMLESIRDNQAPPLKKRKIEEGAQANAAAKMLAISHVSEPDRVGGSSKDFRRTLRKVQRGGASFKEAFTGTKQSPPQFNMALTPNTARRSLGTGSYKKPHPPSSFVDNDPDYSDSSDDGF